MSIDSTASFTRRHVGQAVISGLVLMASHVSLAVAADGAQPPKVVDPDLRMPNLVLPQQAVVSPKRITFGQPLPGTLASTDEILVSGLRLDQYSVSVQVPAQPFIITVGSNIPLVVAVKTSAPLALQLWDMRHLTRWARADSSSFLVGSPSRGVILLTSSPSSRS